MINNNKVYIHLGLHKTGTTFFQKDFYPSHSEFNYKPLRDSAVLADFNQYILRENPLSYNTEEAFALFSKNLKYDDNEVLTLCEEQFSGFPLQDAFNRQMIFDRLDTFFPKANYILVLRRQKDFVKSMYGEYLKKGGTSSLSDFLNRKGPSLSFSRGSYLKYYDYYQYIENRVGRNRIKVLYYEDFKYYPEYFMTELLDFFKLKVDLKTTNLALRRNESFSTDFYEAIRFFNRIGRTPYGMDHFLPSRFKRYIVILHHKIFKKKRYFNEFEIDNFLMRFDFKNELLPDYENIKKHKY